MSACSGWSFRIKNRKQETMGQMGRAEEWGTGITKHKNHQKTIETKTDTDVSGTLHCIVLSFSNFLATALQLRVQNINVKCVRVFRRVCAAVWRCAARAGDLTCGVDFVVLSVENVTKWSLVMGLTNTPLEELKTARVYFSTRAERMHWLVTDATEWPFYCVCVSTLYVCVLLYGKPIKSGNRCVDFTPTRRWKYPSSKNGTSAIHFVLI